jgi:hypothetical protein
MSTYAILARCSVVGVRGNNESVHDRPPCLVRLCTRAE